MSAEPDRNRDERWMVAYRRDDPEAFARIYEAYADPVYGYLVKRVPEEAERDDLFQRIWMKFHRSRDLWSPEYPLLQWLFVIARSAILDRYRARAKSPFGALVEDSEATLGKISVPGGEDSGGALEQREEENAVADRMRCEGLSDEQVEVVRSRVFADEEYAEIARRLGKSAISVRKIFSRAIEKLRLARAVEGKR